VRDDALVLVVVVAAGVEVPVEPREVLLDTSMRSRCPGPNQLLVVSGWRVTC